MSGTSEIHFGPFRLLGRHGPLLRGEQELRLQAKTLTLLWTLARQLGEVVTRQTLTDALWPREIVSEDALAFQVQQLRAQIEDDPKSPRYLITAHRVGFRLLAPGAAPAEASRFFVGRRSELETLQGLLDQAGKARRQMVFISDEAGIGKTQLIEAFLTTLAGSGARLIRGHCLEQQGAGEAYLPIIEALGQLLREAADEQPLELMRRLAPSWLQQLPSLIGAAEQAQLRRQTTGVTPARMRRELAEALEALSQRQPLVLVIEDLHWSESATTELLALLAQRREPARLMILVSLRPVEAIVGNPAARTLQVNLGARSRAQTLNLGTLPAESVQAYLAQRFQRTPLSKPITTQVLERSGGHPLFMSQIAEFIAYGPEGADVRGARLRHQLPQTLLDLIEAQLRHLDLSEQLLLECASIAGNEFSAAATAAAAGLAPDLAEAALEKLAQQGRFIESQGLVVWPDGTASDRFRFRHGLYAQALRSRISPTREPQLHRRVAERAEQGYGTRAAEVAAELAYHYECAGLAAKAALYCMLSARQALQRVAFDDSLAQARRGLEMLNALDPSRERDALEAALHTAAAAALQTLRGHAHPEAQAHLDRIETLLPQVQDPALLELALSQLWMARHFAMRIDEAIEYAGRTQALGRTLKKPVLECAGHAWASLSLHIAGRARASETAGAQALRLVRVASTGSAGRVPLEPGCAAIISRGVTRNLLGFPEQSLKALRQSLDCVARIGNPYTECVHRVAGLQNILVQQRRFQQVVNGHAGLLAFCQKHGHLDASNWALTLHALAQCFLGRAADYLPALRQHMQAMRVSGSLISVPLHRLLEAEICRGLGQLGEARNAMEAAFDVLQNTGSKVMEPEAWRQEALLLLAEDPNDFGLAERNLKKALDLAHQRGARFYELRAAMDLARLWQRQGKTDAAREQLHGVYARFTEGHDLPDLVEARELLERLKPPTQAKRKRRPRR